jgi:hypothetical protein
MDVNAVEENVAECTTDSSTRVIAAAKEDVEKPTEVSEKTEETAGVEIEVVHTATNINVEGPSTTEELESAPLATTSENEVVDSQHNDDACQSNTENTQEAKEEEEDSQLIIPAVSSSSDSSSSSSSGGGDGGSSDNDGENTTQSESSNEDGYVKIVRTPCGEPMSESELLHAATATATVEEKVEEKEGTLVKRAIEEESAEAEQQPCQDGKEEEEQEDELLLPSASVDESTAEVGVSISNVGTNNDGKQRAQKKNKKKKKKEKSNTK